MRSFRCTSLFLLLTVCVLRLSSQDTSICLSQHEYELYNLINTYRSAQGLEPVASSLALTHVAQTHVHDLVDNKPFDEDGLCNPHSWSDTCTWLGCCYDGKPESGPCMWRKPRELTSYSADGYEIVMYSATSDDLTREVTAERALKLWQESKNHNDVILNKAMWKDVKWKAMGVGIFQGFAAIWFGRDLDSTGSPSRSAPY